MGLAGGGLEFVPLHGDPKQAKLAKNMNEQHQQAQSLQVKQLGSKVAGEGSSNMGMNSNTYSVSSAAHEKPQKDSAAAAKPSKKAETSKTGASKKKKKTN